MRPPSTVSRAAARAVALVLALGAGSAPARPPATALHADSTAAGAPRVLRQGEDLQRALDDARPGDVILLEPGAAFDGPFTLPAKSGEDWITLRTGVPDGTFPPAGTRVGPEHASMMPRLESSGPFVLAAAPGAHRYRLVGLEVRPKPGVFMTHLVVLGTDEDTLEALPRDVVVERCYVHGDPRKGSRRGIALNGRSVTIADSYLSDFKEVGADSQAIAGWNGPGPFRIVNNYLEAAGENVMFGGGDPSIRGLVPSDIEVRGNLFRKPLSWKSEEPSFEGTAWTVKNLFELKNARRVVVDGNTFENNWAHAQSGFAILFTVRNQDGQSPWSVVEDVTFRSNVVRHVAAGINILGRDARPSGQTRRVTVADNLFEDVGGERWGGSGALLQVLEGTADVVFEHNTALNSGNIITAEGRPHAGFVFRDNIAVHNAYGVAGTGTAPGRSTLETYFPGALFRRNVIVGGDPARHPRDNFFPPSVESVRFLDSEMGDYRLSSASPYKRAATDGSDVGADLGERHPTFASAAPR